MLYDILFKLAIRENGMNYNIIHILKLAGSLSANYFMEHTPKSLLGVIMFMYRKTHLLLNDMACACRRTSIV